MSKINRKNNFSECIFFFIILFYIIFPQISHATIFQPGETLEPDCPPGSLNCGVEVFKLNGQDNSLQTLTTSTSGTDFSISSAGSVHTFNLPSASLLSRGLLSASDWNIFNNKLSASTPITVTSATTPLIIGGTNNTSTLTLRPTSGVGASGADIIFQTGNNGATEAIRILNSGNVGIGTANPLTKLTVMDTSASSPRGIQSMQSSDDTGGARVGFSKSRGTPTSPTAVLSGDTLGRLMFRGYDGANYLEMGSIEVGASGTVTATRIPTFLAFSTGTNATPSVLTERMRIDNAGNVGIGTTNPVSKLNVIKAGDYNSEGNTGFKILSSEASPAVSLQMGTDTTNNIGFIQAMQPLVSWSTRPLVLQGNGGNVGIGNINPGALLDVGLAGTTLGVIRLAGSTSGNVSLQPNAVAGSGVILTLPATSGTIALTNSSITGNAATATALQTPRTINGVAFDGTANITISAAADAGTLTGTTLAANVVNSSLTSVGTLTNLTVTNPISGSITGNAATVTTNANLTGAITSVGNATSLGSFTSASLSGALTDETGTGIAVFATSPTLVTPTLGVATATSVTGGTTLTLKSANGANAITVDSGTTGAVNIGTGNNSKTISIGSVGTPSNTVVIGNSNSTVSINSTGLNVTTGGALTGVSSIDTINFTSSGITFASTGNIQSTSTNPLTLDSTTTGDVNLGTGTTGAGKIVNIGNTNGTTQLNLNAGTNGIFLAGAAAAGAGHLVVCIDNVTNQLFFGASATSCSPSSAQYKHEIVDISLGLDAVNALRPVSYVYNSNNEPTLGFIAEEAGLVDERLAVRDRNGVIQAINPDAFTPILTRAIQQMSVLLGDISPKINAAGADNGLSSLVVTIQSENAHDPVAIIAKKISDGKQFLTDFVSARVTAIRGYFDEIFTKKLHTDELCVKKSDGNEICVNGDKLNSLLQNMDVNPTVTPTSSKSENEVGSSDPAEKPTSTLPPKISETPIIIDPISTSMEEVASTEPVTNSAGQQADNSGTDISQ